MDLSFDKHIFTGSLLEQSPVPTQIPIFHSPFFSTPVSPLLPPFLSIQNNLTPRWSTVLPQSTWSPSVYVPSPEILPQYSTPVQLPRDLDKVQGIYPVYSEPLGVGLKSPLPLKYSTSIDDPNQQPDVQKIDTTYQQNLCYASRFSIPTLEVKFDDYNLRTNSPCSTIPIPKMPKSSFHIGYYVPPTVDPGDPYGGLNLVWHKHFELLFRMFRQDVWTFEPTENVLQGWITFKDMAKVRFSCQKCQHGWTSMHGVVVFYYQFDEVQRTGNVRFILMGQKCIQCHSPKFETPMWYPEEAQKVMTNLFYEIASRVYGIKAPPLIKERRHGRPRQQHVASDCQGCHMKICKPPPPPLNTQDKTSTKKA